MLRFLWKKTNDIKSRWNRKEQHCRLKIIKDQPGLTRNPEKFLELKVTGNAKEWLSVSARFWCYSGLKMTQAQNLLFGTCQDKWGNVLEASETAAVSGSSTHCRCSASHVLTLLNGDQSFHLNLKQSHLEASRQWIKGECETCRQ